MIGCNPHNPVYAQPRKWFWGRLGRTFDSCQDETDNLAESRPPDEGEEGRKWKENAGIIAETTSDNVGWNRNWHNSSPWNEHIFWFLWGKTWCSGLSYCCCCRCGVNHELGICMVDQCWVHHSWRSRDLLRMRWRICRFSRFFNALEWPSSFI